MQAARVSAPPLRVSVRMLHPAAALHLGGRLDQPPRRGSTMPKTIATWPTTKEQRDQRRVDGEFLARLRSFADQAEFQSRDTGEEERRRQIAPTAS